MSQSSFFAQSSLHDEIDRFRKDLQLNIFSAIELSKGSISYQDIMQMPINRFSDYLIWKSDLEKAKQEKINEQ